MFSSCYSEKKSEQMIITNLILFSRFFYYHTLLYMYLKFRIQGGGLRWRPYAQPSFPLGELEGG